jgi:hypothetical protein
MFLLKTFLLNIGVISKKDVRKMFIFQDVATEKFRQNVCMQTGVFPSMSRGRIQQM